MLVKLLGSWGQSFLPRSYNTKVLGFMAIRYKCVHCNIVLSGEGASRHYLANPTHKLEKLPPPPKPVKNPTR